MNRTWKSDQYAGSSRNGSMPGNGLDMAGSSSGRKILPLAYCRRMQVTSPSDRVVRHEHPDAARRDVDGLAGAQFQLLVARVGEVHGERALRFERLQVDAGHGAGGVEVQHAGAQFGVAGAGAVDVEL